jgi:hypothetical protein
MSLTASANIMERPLQGESPVRWGDPGKNPWVSDHVLLGLSVWWVKMTHPEVDDFSSEVAVVFSDLQRDLQ